MRAASPRRHLARSAFALTFAVALAAMAQDEQRSGLRKFMRQKLEFSQGILEGLSTENFALIAKDADALKALSQDTRWRVTPNINYFRLSSEFQDLADELARNARKGNLDGATLAYVDMTMNCVKCHKLVRDQKLITRRLGREMRGSTAGVGLR